jgi:hypothetical protein
MGTKNVLPYQENKKKCRWGEKHTQKKKKRNLKKALLCSLPIQSCHCPQKPGHSATQPLTHMRLLISMLMWSSHVAQNTVWLLAARNNRWTPFLLWEGEPASKSEIGFVYSIVDAGGVALSQAVPSAPTQFQTNANHQWGIFNDVWFWYTNLWYYKLLYYYEKC